MSVADSLKVLEIDTCSSESELKDAYYKQIRLWHPDQYHIDADKFIQATERTKIINAANDSLLAFLRSESSPKMKPGTNGKSKSPAKRRSYPSGFPDRDVAEVHVKSTNILSVGYSNRSRTLYIKFKGSVVYGYFDVPHSLYKEFIMAKSLEAYMDTNLNGNFQSMRL